jgi:carbohydrate-binding DOMON domain-containing protein
MRKLLTVSVILVLFLAQAALAGDVKFSDPKGDDHGPGEYVYPTDAVYEAGSFDLTKFEVEDKGDNVEFAATMAAKLDDPWRMGGGFSVQMIFIFIDNAEGGFTTCPPGLNVEFDESTAWDVCVVLSPQPMSRVRQEADAKAGAMASSILAPVRVKGKRSTISGAVPKADLGEGDPATWKYQVLVQSNEGFPSGGDMLTRKVNEFEGQHRFGGGTDFDCDPHVMDMLGDHAQLKAYECNEDGTTKKLAVIKLINP